MTKKTSTIVENPESITKNYCRKCMQTLPVDKFYKAVDLGYIDSNGFLSVCKECVNKLYDEEFSITGNIERSVHKLCIALNIKFSQPALEATKTHIQTQIDNNISHSPVFSTYKSKLIATNKSMDKSIQDSMVYEDVSTIYLSPDMQKKDIEIPSELKAMWGNNYSFDDIQFLESQYASAKQTHRADTFAEITLLKEVCYKMLDIKKARENDRSTASAVKELQDIMKSLSISPNAVNASGNGKAMDSFGLWVQEIEKEEPAQWLQGDGKKFEMYRDVSNVEEYFQKYFVRPLKNFITSSKDFNIDDNDKDDDDAEFGDIDDGQVGE